MQKLRKALVVGVMAVTVLSVSMLAVPFQVDAAAQAGDLIKMDGLSSVYYLGADGKRYVFPNESTYFSWYSDFSGVVTIPQSELETYPLGANVTVRPGTKLVKITTDPKVYAVEPDGNLIHVPSEATAIALYGADWAKRVIDVADSFFTNYTVTGTQVGATAYPTGSLVKFGAAADVYYIDANGDARKIANEAAFLANRFKWDDVITSSLTLPALAGDITGAESALTDTSSGAGGTAGAGTGLTVSVSALTPTSMNIPSSATGVTFTKVNLTAASDGAVTVNTLIVKRTGIGAYDDLSKVYLYEGDVRLTSGKSLNSSTNEATFTNLGLNIPAGTTKTISIVADIAASVSGNHVLGIASASAVTTNGAVVSGSFPVNGNNMSLSTTNVGTIDVESSGADWTRKVGETQVEVANFTVYAGSVEDALFKGITLYNSGRDVLSNLKMYRGTTLVAEAVKSGNYFIFTLDTPYDIAKNESANFSVKGDIGGRDSDTATISVRYNTDVKAEGKTYGYNLSVNKDTGTGDTSYIEETTAGTLTSNTTTVDAGQVTVSFNGPAAGDVAVDSNDVILMNFNVTTASEVEVSKATIAISGTVAVSDVENLELVCDGVVVGDTAAVAIGNNAFTDTWILQTGTTPCSVRIDITNTASGTENITGALVDLSSANWVMKDANGDAITDIVPTGNITGNQMSLTNASLEVSLASTPASGQTYVKGQSKAGMAGFTFTAGEAADTKLTALTFLAYRDANQGGFAAGDINHESGAANVLVSIYLYDGETLLANKSLTVGASNISVTFSSLDVAIAAGQSKTLTVKSDISTSLADADNVAIALSSATAEYGNGKNLGVTGTPANDTPTVYQTIGTGGTLTMSAHADTPTTALVVAGAARVPFTKVKFAGTDEIFIIDRLTVVNDRYATVGDDEFTSIELMYTKQDGTTEYVVKSLNSGIASFSGLSIYVPKDGNTTVTVLGNLNTKSGGADNGDYTSLYVASSTDLYTFRAVGQASSVTKTSTNSADVDGADMIVYKSIPTVAFTSNTPSGTLTPGGNTKLARIQVTADAGDDIQFMQSSTGLATSSITIAVAASVNDGSGVKTWTLKDGDGNTLDTVSAIATTTSVTFDFTDRAFTVPAGTTKYLEVYLDTTQFEDDGDSIYLWLDDSANTNIQWSIDGTGEYGHAGIIFKGDPVGGTLQK